MTEKEIEDANKKSSYIAATINLANGIFIIYLSYIVPEKDKYSHLLGSSVLFALGFLFIAISQIEFRNVAMMRRIMKK